MSQTLNINAPPGVTAVKAFTRDSDTVVATAATVTAGTNDPSFYTIVFTSLVDGVYRIVFYEGASVVAVEDVSVGDGVFDISEIDPSDPGKRTGYYVCYDENGDVESGVDVACRCQSASGTTGLALDSKDRTETSDAEGLVQFTNLIVGVRYRFRRGSGNWQDFLVRAGSGAFAIDSLLGKDPA
jgi:hypothetical protein